MSPEEEEDEDKEEDEKASSCTGRGARVELVDETEEVDTAGLDES